MLLHCIVFFLFEFLVEVENATFFVKVVLHFEEDGGDIQKNQDIVIKASVFAALVICLVAVILDMAHQFFLVSYVHRLQLLLHYINQELRLQLRVHCFEGLNIVALEVA